MEAIPTGSLALDFALGIGGVPRGRITEIFGPDGSGKTTLVYSILAQAQETEPGWVFYLDVEHRGDLTYMESVGVKADKLAISQPGSGEQALEIVEAALESKGFSAVNSFIVSNRIVDKCNMVIYTKSKELKNET